MMGERWHTLRDLSVALSDVGRIRVMAGDLAGGTAAHKESGETPQTPQTLRDLGISLRNFAAALRKVGDLAGAAAADDEARVLERRLASAGGGAGLSE